MSLIIGYLVSLHSIHTNNKLTMYRLWALCVVLGIIFNVYMLTKAEDEEKTKMVEKKKSKYRNKKYRDENNDKRERRQPLGLVLYTFWMDI